MFALTGERRTELGEQDVPDLHLVLAYLRPAHHDPGVKCSSGRLGTRTYPVPTDLARGIGPAQFSATLRELRHRLRAGDQPSVVAADRTLDRDERRLAADVPPHHS